MNIIIKDKNKKPRQAKFNSHGVKGEQETNFKLVRLTQIDNDTKLLTNVYLVDECGLSHQIDHIVIRSNGVFCIETKNWQGSVYGKEKGPWTQYINKERYTLSNPIEQNKTHCREINKIIGPKYFANSVIVMANNNSDKINIPNVINVRHLKHYLRLFDNGVLLSKEEIELIYNKINNYKVDMTREEHIANYK